MCLPRLATPSYIQCQLFFHLLREPGKNSSIQRQDYEVVLFCASGGKHSSRAQDRYRRDMATERLKILLQVTLATAAKIAQRIIRKGWRLIL